MEENNRSMHARTIEIHFEMDLKDQGFFVVVKFLTNKDPVKQIH